MAGIPTARRHPDLRTCGMFCSASARSENRALLQWARLGHLIFFVGNRRARQAERPGRRQSSPSAKNRERPLTADADTVEKLEIPAHPQFCQIRARYESRPCVRSTDHECLSHSHNRDLADFRPDMPCCRVRRPPTRHGLFIVPTNRKRLAWSERELRPNDNFGRAGVARELKHELQRSRYVVGLDHV